MANEVCDRHSYALVDEKLEIKAQKRIALLLKRARQKKGVVDEEMGQLDDENKTSGCRINNLEKDEICLISSQQKIENINNFKETSNEIDLETANKKHDTICRIIKVDSENKLRQNEQVINESTSVQSKENISKNLNERILNRKESTNIESKEINLDNNCNNKKEATSIQTNWCKINSHQCYVCFKLYQTKEELLDHCKIHFDVCNTTILKKCPLCDYVTNRNLSRHLSIMHNLEIKLGNNSLQDRRDNNNGSRFYYNLNNDLVKEIEVIPSVKSLNKEAYMKIDKMKRESKFHGLQKTKLVKKGGEWLIENKKLSIKDGDLDIYKDKDLSGDYLLKVKAISHQAKNNGQQVIFPCNRCEKICQTFSALTLHYRKHEENPKPFKPKVWKHKTKMVVETKKAEIIRPESTNRYEKPRPITNKHKCDPKLIEFYEKNIKGSDIEFWHFLKIYNKMSRENINDFPDLVNRPEFGIHDNNIDANNTADNINKITDTYKTYENNIAGTNKIVDKIPNKTIDLNVKPFTIIPKSKFSYNRTIRISKKDYNKRKLIQERLRKNIAAKILM